jgi:hypothetical protein
MKNMRFRTDAAAAAAVAAALDQEGEGGGLGYGHRPSRNAAKVANQKIKKRENPELAAQAEISTFGMTAAEAAGARSPKAQAGGATRRAGAGARP